MFVEIFLPILLAFFLGLLVGRALWRTMPASTVGTSAADAPSLDLRTADIHEVDRSPAPTALVASARTVSAQHSAPSSVTALTTVDDELAATRDQLAVVRDDLSSSDAQLVVAKEDLRATRQLLLRAEAELAAARTRRADREGALAAGSDQASEGADEEE